jgi:hypothetical protein
MFRLKKIENKPFCGNKKVDYRKTTNELLKIAKSDEFRAIV